MREAQATQGDSAERRHEALPEEAAAAEGSLPAL